MGGGHPVGLQKNHDVLDLALLDPGVADTRAAHRPDAVHLEKPLWMAVDRLERVEPEVAHQALRHHLADAADEAGAQVPLDADERRGRDGHEAVDAELLAIAAVVHPRAVEPHALAGLDAEEVPDGSDGLAPAGNGQAHDAPRRRFVDVDDVLENAFEQRARGGGGHRAAAEACAPPRHRRRCRTRHQLAQSDATRETGSKRAKWSTALHSMECTSLA